MTSTPARKTLTLILLHLIQWVNNKIIFVYNEFITHNSFFSLAPLTLKQTATDINILQTQNAQIAFEVDGLPRPNITWLLNGTPIQSSAKYKMETKGNQFILNINKTDFVDSGTYTAVIDNGIEKLEVPVKMNVGGIFIHRSIS
jgi:hypothetical protein